MRRLLPGVYNDCMFGVMSLTILFLPLPMLILAAINISWLVNLPSPVRHAVDEGLGSHFIGIAVCGLLGSVVWINNFVVFVFASQCFNFDSHRIMSLALTFWVLGSLVLCEIFWVVYAALTPWHPESKISHEALSVPTVLSGCRQILALKCLIIINLCCMAIWILLILLAPMKEWKPAGVRRRTVPSMIHVVEDGASVPPAQPDGGQRDSELEEISSSSLEKGLTSVELGKTVASMDGAG